MSEYTPGPWHETFNGGRRPYVIRSASGAIVGESYWDNAVMDEPTVESAANARLIAAAPELLDVCKHALFLLSGLSTDGEITMTPEGKDRITAELRAAIAKAEGKSVAAQAK